MIIMILFRGENILLFLVQTVGRQLVEQRQYRPARTRAPGTRNKTLAQELGKLGLYTQSIILCLVKFEFVVLTEFE